ncbi:MAG: hypothetical protein RIR55_29 [Bacteroidota bacterium]
MKLLKSNLDSLAAAIVGGLLVMLLTKHSGLGISPDSIYYLSTADSIIAGKGFYQFDGKPFVMFPVGFPILLSLIKVIVGGSFLKVIPFFNAFLFGTTIFLTGLIFENTNHTKWLKWVVLLIIALSPSLLEIYTMLWSETLFITEIVLFIYFGKIYFEKYSLQSLIVIAVIAAIAADTRLAGVAVIATGGLLILMTPELKWGRKIQHALIYGSISVSLFVINLIRNALLTETLTGNRQKGVTPFLENLKYYGLVLTNWLPFSKWITALPTFIAFLFLTIVFIVFLVRFIKSKEQHHYEKIAVAFTLIYSIFMLTVATISRFETINNRLLAPFYIPCVLTLSFYGASIFKTVKTGVYKFILLGMSTLFIGVLFFQYLETDRASYLENIEGGIGGYSDDDWFISSGLLNYLNTNPAFFKGDKPIYSNAAHAVYFKTNQSAQILPERKYAHLVAEFNNTPAQILIWFNNEDNPEVLTLQEVGNTKNLQIIGKFNDGVIYLCTSK